uniref:INO80 complex subunit C n=1 Tax=Crocodylus porosus TaxID=8502 RepID=A0A7M4F8G7_CROPO
FNSPPCPTDPSWGPSGPDAGQHGPPCEAMNENKFLSTDPGTGPMEAAKPLPFKDPNFMHSGIGGAAAGKKNRTWKNLKQILASERALPWQLNDPSYFNIDAPPSFKPAKKYSDISGLPVSIFSLSTIHYSPWVGLCTPENRLTLSLSSLTRALLETARTQYLPSFPCCSLLKQRSTLPPSLPSPAARTPAPRTLGMLANSERYLCVCVSSFTGTSRQNNVHLGLFEANQQVSW